MGRYLSDEEDERCHTLRYVEELTLAEIACVVDHSRAAVSAAVQRHHLQVHSCLPPRVFNGRAAEGERRQARAYALIHHGIVTHQTPVEELKLRTGYPNWHMVRHAATEHSRRVGKPLAHADWGTLLVRAIAGRGPRLVLCTKPIRNAGWNAGDRIRWSVHGETIRLERLRAEHIPSVYRTHGDTGGDAYYWRFQQGLSWNDIGPVLGMTGNGALQAARRFAEQRSLPFYKRGGDTKGTGIVRVTLVNGKTKRPQMAVVLERVACDLGWQAGAEIRWVVRPGKLPGCRFIELRCDASTQPVD